MVKVLILGSTGMLGSAVGKWFLNQPERYETYLTYRNKDLSYGENRVFFDCLLGNFDSLPKVDYAINCIGTIKPFMASDPLAAIEINSAFPWRFSEYCVKNNIRLIHITTDCVFSGAKGGYTEEDDHDALDNYGKSKSLGESTNCMVLRTSIIGEEIHKNASLVEWVKNQKGNKVNGFVNHFWNGITTKQYAKICDKIISNDLYKTSKFHVSSPDWVTKHQLVSMLGKKFNLDLVVEKFEAPTSVDRTLSTVKELADQLDVPSIEQQIEEL